jgi:predicted nucleic acid-binding Zn ribbon protein
VKEHSEPDPQPIAGALDRVLKGLGTPGVAAIKTVFSHWGELVGAEVASHVKPVSLDRGCLLVAVDAPGWATRFRYGQATLLAHLAEELGEGVVTRIDVRVRGT